jgi:hypothetical protein
LNYELITAVGSRADRAWEELTVVANSPGATVIFLRTHPRWIAAQRRERERSDAMSRHPSARLFERSRASGGGGSPHASPHARGFTVFTSNDTPA